MHLIIENGEYLLFNNGSMNIYKLTEEQGKKLEKYTDTELDSLFQGLEEIPDANERGEIECRRADRVIIVVSQACNMGCKYCYAQEGTYGETGKQMMTFEVLKQSVEKAISIFPEGVDRFQFFGGEPLVNFELIKKATPWIISYFEERGLQKPGFTIVTNGTLITPEVHRFFQEYEVNVTISIDGNKSVNDVNRVFKNSDQSTFDVITKNIEMINKDRNYILMLEMTVDRENYLQYKNNGEKLLDVEALLAYKPDLFHIVPAIWPEGHNCSFQEDGIYQEMQNYFTSVAKLANERFGTEEPFHVMKMADMARTIIKKKKKRLLCGAGINQMSIDVNGDMYPCFAFIGQSEFFMGNTKDKENIQFEKVKATCKENTYNHITECKNCWANGLCSNCIGNSYLLHKRIDKPIEELCTVQKATLEQTIYSCYRMVTKSGVVE